MAFLVPILQKLAENPAVIFAVILTPTRFVVPVPLPQSSRERNG